MDELNVKICVSENPTEAKVFLNGVDVASKCFALNYSVNGGESSLLTLFLLPDYVEIEDETATVEKKFTEE